MYMYMDTEIRKHVTEYYSYTCTFGCLLVVHVHVHVYVYVYVVVTMGSLPLTMSMHMGC